MGIFKYKLNPITDELDMYEDFAADITAAISTSNAYADSLVVGLWDDRGNYDASTNTYPTTGGSGTAGAVKKGDTWLVTVAGVLPTSQIVELGDTLRALSDTPGQTQGNWAILQANATGTNLQNTLYVAVNGNDTTGARNNLAKPFLTLEAARDAAVSGDTIFVYPGAYAVTTTATNGLAKDGVNWFFYPGAIVTKTTNGWMFNMIGLTLASNVYGKGSFYKTGGTQGVHRCGDNGDYTSLECTFEADYVQQTVAYATFLSNNNSANLLTYNVRKAVATGNYLMFIFQSGNILINATYWQSTAGAAIYVYNGSTYITVNSESVISTTTSAIAGLYQVAYANFNINYCFGLNYGYSTSGGTNTINISGNTNGINNTSFGLITHNGYCGNLVNSGPGNVTCGSVGYSTISGGSVSYKMLGSSNTYHNISGGYANIELSNEGYSFYLNATGGKTILHGNGYNNYTIGNRTIAGGIVILNGDLEYGGTDYLGNREVFTLTSGKLVINGRIKNLLTAQSTAACVIYSGGTLVANAGVLLTSNVEAPPIIVSGANRNIKVLAGGLSTNRITGLLSAKKQKHKQTVQAISTTSIQLNDGVGGWEVFTVSDTVTYNTQAKIAQQMAVLINASGTLDITASQDTPGTDAYFYVESDVAGTPFTTQTVVNITNAVIRENSYALTNTTGGVIIEDADVE